jgi:Fe-S-cluster containining protein
MIYKNLLGQAKENYLDNRKLTQKLKKSNNREVDTLFHTEHVKAFKKIDCLSCANCCKTTSPIFRDVDVKRISKRLRMPIGKFIETYLRMDDDKDFVLKTSPCAFLDDDNTCSIYEDRPLACREYPHTDRKNMYQILDLTLTNTLICPAVSEIFNKIKEKGK